MTEGETWDIGFYIDARGGSPVEEFLADLPKDDRARLAYALVRLAEFGVRLKGPHAAPIDGPLWELRGGAGRLFYFAYTGRRFIILHGYIKKGQKAPKKEIAMARRRWQDFLAREAT